MQPSFQLLEFKSDLVCESDKFGRPCTPMNALRPIVQLQAAHVMQGATSQCEVVVIQFATAQLGVVRLSTRYSLP